MEWREIFMWLQLNSAAFIFATIIVSGALGVWMWRWQHDHVVRVLEAQLNEERSGAEEWRGVALALLGDLADRAQAQGRPLPATRASLTALRLALSDLFSESDLQNIFFDLGVDYDATPGETKGDKARGLVLHMERLKRLPDLVEHIDRYRPGWRTQG